jgi:hypothetical protein
MTAVFFRLGARMPLSIYMDEAELAPEPVIEYTPEFCQQDAARAAAEETSAAVEKLWTAGAMTPDAAFSTVMYMLESRWPPSFLEAEYRASRWLVAARALEGTGLWPRYVSAERAWEMHGIQSADVELREACGRAWLAADLHHIGRHFEKRQRHHSEKPRERKPRARRKRTEDTSIRLWLCPEVKAERAEQSSGIMRGTIR